MKLGRDITSKNMLEMSRVDRKTSQGYVDVKSKTINQLIELIERQNKLLQNRSFSEKLPDKGEKIKFFKAELETELKKKQEQCDETCQLMFNLNLKDKSAEEIEWNEGKLKTCEEQLDSDDEESREVTIDPLKILASHSGTVKGRELKSNFLETEDLSSNKNSFYVYKICEKYEKPNIISFPKRFKPNQLKNNDKSLFKTSAEKVQERLGDKWEVTEATPPAPIFEDTRMISLKESLKLLEEQAKKLEEIEKKNAIEKLLKISVKMGDKLPIHNVTEYRTGENLCDDSDKDYEETEPNYSDS